MYQTIAMLQDQINLSAFDLLVLSTCISPMVTFTIMKRICLYIPCRADYNLEVHCRLKEFILISSLYINTYSVHVHNYKVMFEVSID